MRVDTPGMSTVPKGLCIYYVILFGAFPRQINDSKSEGKKRKGKRFMAPSSHPGAPLISEEQLGRVWGGAGGIWCRGGEGEEKKMVHGEIW